MDPPRSRPPTADGPTLTAVDSKNVEALKSAANLLRADAGTGRPNDLSRLFSPTIADHEVVLVVPSFDLRLSENEQNDVLPEVGEHAEGHHSAEAKLEKVQTAGEATRPTMTASVLSLTQENKSVVEQKAMGNIGKTTSWTRSTSNYASGAISTNLSGSFTVLLNARLRAWTLLLLRHSLSTGSNASRKRLLSMLASKIQVKSLTTSFKALPLPDLAAGAKPRDSDVVLPMLFEAKIGISCQDQTNSVTLRAPGTLSSILAADEKLQRVTVHVDTTVLLKSMVDQARRAVLKAVSKFTDATAVVPEASEKLLAVIPESEEAAKPKIGVAGSLGSFRRAMDLMPSETGKNATLAKARSSALRLNSVLHSRPSKPEASSLGPRKIRSIRWEHPAAPGPTLNTALAPNPKKMRVIPTAAKLQSFISFGRPHASDFGSGPRNATFGEYGSVGLWGRDGRMAQHPKPMQAAAGNDPLMNNFSNSAQAKNATFDNIKQSSAGGVTFEGASQSAAASAGAALLGRTLPSARTSSSARVQRTATALESFLMKEWTT